MTKCVSRRAGLVFMAMALMVATSPALAFIHLMYPLSRVLDESTNVLVGSISSVDAAGTTAVVKVEKALKGKPEFRVINMNIGLGPGHHARYMMSRLKERSPAIIFYERKGREIASLVHAGDTWFQLFAADNPKKRDKIWWRFTHVELHFGRTFNGTTPELIKLTDDVLAKRRKPPKPNPKVPAVDLRVLPARSVAAQKSGKARGGFHRQTHFDRPGGGEIRGVSFADVNGDGLLDVHACRAGGNVLLVNEGGEFREMARKLGIAGGSRSAVWADYNGDGHPDLLTQDFRLYTNVGGRFRDDSSLLKPPGGRNPEGAGWIDHNGDGQPDAIIANGETGIYLYENTGQTKGRFRDVSGRVGLGRKGLGRGNGDFLALLDCDGDGYTDFYYNLGPGVLARNRRGKGFDLDARADLELVPPVGNEGKRGVAVGDFDNDGDLDVFVPTPLPTKGKCRPALYRNENDGTFKDVFGQCGDPTKEEDPCFAGAWGDVNGDGHLDLFVCHTYGSTRLYLGDGAGRFQDVSEQTGVRPLSPAFGAGFADLDGDGDLDLAVNLESGVVIAFNDMSPPSGRRPVTVSLSVRKGALGAVVRALAGDGELLGLRELNGGEGPGGQACPVAHFSLPAEACKVAVALSDGRVAMKALPADPKANRVKLTLQDKDFE